MYSSTVRRNNFDITLFVLRCAFVGLIAVVAWFLERKRNEPNLHTSLAVHGEQSSDLEGELHHVERQ